MTARLSIIELADQARAIREDADSDLIAAHALYAFVASLADQAQKLRNTVSGDVYAQRGLGMWDLDMSRLQHQLAQVMRPTLEGRGGPDASYERDVIRPILDGVWPAWLSSLPQYADGVQMRDPLLPPTATPVRDGSFQTQPVVASVGALWNQAFEAAEFDASHDGNDDASRWVKEAVTSMRAYFEGEAPGDTNRTAWADARNLFAAVGKAAGDVGGALYDGFGSGFGTVLGYAAAGVGVLLLVRALLRR